MTPPHSPRRSGSEWAIKEAEKLWEKLENMTMQTNWRVETIALALEKARQDEREANVKAVCSGCRDGWELDSIGHFKQLEQEKDKNGKFVYNPARQDCVALPIRNRQDGG